MKGIENIVGRILGDAEISASEIAAAAEAQAGQIVAQAKQQAEQNYAAGMKNAATEADNVLLRGKSMADLEGRKALLTAKQDAVELAFVKAEQALADVTKDPTKYAQLLIGLAKPNLTPGCKVRLSKADAPSVGEVVKVGLGVPVEAADMPSGGLVLLSGGIELNLTFSALLRQYREELEQAVAAVLFG